MYTMNNREGVSMENDRHAMLNIGVFAIIFGDKKRILFCHRTDYDLWNLPGGVLEKDEAPCQVLGLGY